MLLSAGAGMCGCRHKLKVSMSKIIVYLDVEAHPREQLARQFRKVSPARPMHWVLVACPAPSGHRIHHRIRQAHRSRWAQEISDDIAPLLRTRGDAVSTVFASDLLDDRTRELLSRDATTRVIDARQFPSSRSTGSPRSEARSPWLVLGAAGGVAAAALLMAN